MKKSFLEYVAHDLFQKFGSNLAHVTIVFPNKRASLFLNEYLARIIDKPFWSPTYITISDLFRKHTKLVVGDEIKLISDLYKVFINCTRVNETLDHFYGWGQLLLNDFDDIDKNLAVAKKVFANLKDIHEMDDVSYLTEEQQQIIKRFFSNFTEDQNTELKKRFLSVWSNLGDIYSQYNRLLRDQGITYEGALYRTVIEDNDLIFTSDKYAFVGFNFLHQVEQELFRKLKQENRAVFYWDFDHYYLNNNEAGHYIQQYLKLFPNELDNQDHHIFDHFKDQKEITFLSAPTENIQARSITRWLRNNDRYKDSYKTAIVMCDENLLPSIIHSIPPEVEKVNITTGFPLSQTPVYSLMTKLILLQIKGYDNYRKQYRLRYVNACLNHPYSKYISSNSQSLKNHLTTHKIYYPSKEDLSTDEGLSILFKEITPNGQEKDHEVKPDQLCQWMLEVLRLISHSEQTENNPFFQESVFRMYKLINRLTSLIASDDLSLLTPAFVRLFTQIVRSTTIPFHGEPIEGVQVMGILETRNLDFEHVVLLSCNEGKMPKDLNDSSFIPYSIRKSFGLSTIDNKVSIYSYYFHRLLQRASDITIAYNSSTEDGHTGEMSRFMLQLLIESSQKVNKLSLQGGQLQTILHRNKIDKNEQVMSILNSFTNISPTAINRYLRCQIQFYYNLIAGIKEPNNSDDVDQIDNRTFGNIFHRSAQLLYNKITEQSKEIHKSDLEEMMKHREIIEHIVDEAFIDEVFKNKTPGFHPRYNGLQLINREVIINYLLQLLKLDMTLTPFTIKALEKEIYAETFFQTKEGLRKIKIGGFIDRLDEINLQNQESQIRVIDYKTGRPSMLKIYNLEEIFIGNNIEKKHTDYYFQTMLYAMIVRINHELNPSQLSVSPGLLFIQNTYGKAYDPILTFGNEKIEDIAKYQEDFKYHLQKLLSEIFDSTTPFLPTTDKTRCALCAYNQLCGI